jgi:DNA-binding transcriptional ArsR family regulator
MPIGHTRSAAPAVELAVGSGLALLVAFASSSRAPRDVSDHELAAALVSVGDTEGETWLNLFGVLLDAGPPYDVARLVGELASIDPIELRRHLLGRFAWSWCTLAGIDDIEAAAAGDADAAGRLLTYPRYYGGRAAASLGVLIALDPEETRRRIHRAAETGARALLASEAALDAAARDADAVLAHEPPLTAIERLTSGYRYVPEPEAERVILVPHCSALLGLVLAQHRTSRLIAYRAPSTHRREEQLLLLGRALADPKRVEILALVGRGIGGAAELVRATGLSRSTVHHHLAQLREAGLVALEGNARAYTYVPRPDAAEETAALIATVLDKEDH